MIVKEEPPAYETQELGHVTLDPETMKRPSSAGPSQSIPQVAIAQERDQTYGNLPPPVSFLQADLGRGVSEGHRPDLASPSTTTPQIITMPIPHPSYGHPPFYPPHAQIVTGGETGAMLTVPASESTLAVQEPPANCEASSYAMKLESRTVGATETPARDIEAGSSPPAAVAKQKRESNPCRTICCVCIGCHVLSLIIFAIIAVAGGNRRRY